MLKRIHACLALLAAGLLGGCGEGGPSSGGPVDPPPPAAGANLVVASGLRFGSCTGPGCEYTVDYMDNGTGCANNLRGKIRVYELETLLETDDWFLDPSIVISPGESIEVEDCCFSPDTVRRQTRFTTETFWNNVPCS